MGHFGSLFYRDEVLGWPPCKLLPFKVTFRKESPMLRDATQLQPGKLRDEYLWLGLDASSDPLDLGRSIPSQFSVGSVICAQIMSGIHLGA